MPLIRGHHSFDEQFAQIPNAWLRDSRLSFKSRGLLALLMSHSQGWRLSVSGLAVQNAEGKDAIRSAIAELEQFGYLSRSQANDHGRFGEAVWTTHDPADLPSSGFPPSDNPPHKNTITKEDQSKELDAHFDEFWNAYPKKLDKAKAFRAFKSAMKRGKFEDILAGVIAYRNDPQRNPDFTKYPATWLNNDSWENEVAPSADSEAAERARIRKEREREESRRFLEEQRKAEEQSSGPSLCEHGLTIARCVPCAKRLSE
jgi:hypothetical protein